MKALIIFILMLICCKTFAQSKIIYKDTINISGYVYYDNGKPALGTFITSKSRELIYDHDAIGATTDNEGHFVLKGALHQDTLTLTGMLIQQQQYPNRGARYLIITLPTPQTRLLSAPYVLTVTAKRSVRKKTLRLKIQKDDRNEIICGNEQLPEFPGGVQHFFKYISRKLTYPDQAVKNNIEGTVQAQFSVTRDGSLGNIKIIGGIGYGCDEVVKQIIQSSPKWNPGKYNGRSLEVDYIVSVDFKLTDL